MDYNEDFMQQAIALSLEGMHAGEGGPFGCVIVKDGKIIGRGNNKVLLNNDPTAHAEVTAIRDACAAIQNFQLDGCTVYSSCEPCPMCLGAIYWARPAAVYFANTREEAAAIGFDDSMIYDEMAANLADRRIPIVHKPNTNALSVFKKWQAKPDKETY